LHIESGINFVSLVSFWPGCPFDGMQSRYDWCVDQSCLAIVNIAFHLKLLVSNGETASKPDVVQYVQICQTQAGLTANEVRARAGLRWIVYSLVSVYSQLTRELDYMVHGSKSWRNQQYVDIISSLQCNR
jgi:hypothetical protein